MLHSDKPLPDAITHNDEIARLILVELRGLRDELTAQNASPSDARSGKALAGLVAAEMTELREPAPWISEDTRRFIEAITPDEATSEPRPARGRRKAGA